MRMIPIALQAHLNQAATTTCRLLKITLKSGAVYGITSLDRDVIYADSSVGSVTYSSLRGFDSFAIQSDISLSVGNSEALALLGQSSGITEEMLRAGELDDAAWILYLVNFNDLTMGHAVLDFGDIGQVRNRDDMTWKPELLSLIMRLKQPIGGVDSRPCRAIYGTPPASQTGCGVDVTGLWVEGEVEAVGEETDRLFYGTVIPSLPASNYPARVDFLTGDNIGDVFATEEVSTTSNGNEIALVETTPYPIQVGDTYRIRRDCRKNYEADCIAINDNGINFKGEPHIPVGDAVQAQTPDAQIIVHRPGFGGDE